MKRILAIDLGKFKSVACIYDARTGSAKFRTVPTTPAALHDLFVEIAPDRVGDDNSRPGRLPKRNERASHCTS